MSPVFTRTASRKSNDKNQSVTGDLNLRRPRALTSKMNDKDNAGLIVSGENANSPADQPPAPVAVAKCCPKTSASEESPVADTSNLTLKANDSKGLIVAVPNNPKPTRTQVAMAGPSKSSIRRQPAYGGIPGDSRGNILKLPLVVQATLLEYLSTNDEIALRRVCKTTREWVSKQCISRRTLNNWETYCPVINSSIPYGLKYAVSMKVPLSRFEIEINQTHTRAMVNSFLSVHGKNIRSIHFTRTRPRPKLNVPIQGCGNSCACTRRYQCFRCRQQVSILEVLMVDNIRFPSTLGNLQEIKLEITLYTVEEIEVFHRLLENCVSLKKLTLPFVSIDTETHGNLWTSTSDRVAANVLEVGKLFWQPLTEEIQRRGLLNLTVIDMFCWNLSHLNIMNSAKICTQMILFLTEVAAFGVRFLNLPGHIIERYAFSRPDWEFMVVHDNEAIYNKIDSLIYPGPRILSYLSFPNLREITVGNGITIACSSLYIVPESLIMWPNLETINIKILNKNNVEMNGCIKNADTRLLVWERTVRIIEGFRGTIPRSSVRKITVCEELPVDTPTNRSNSVLFSPVTITYTFHRIRVLEISRWDSITDAGFVRLWESLVLLESLKIKKCPKLTDKGFGTNQTNPVFLKLIRLKKLEIDVDSPCSVTDESLELVFSQMVLNEFILTGQISIDPFSRNGRITEDGILGLLDGCLGKKAKKIYIDVDCPPWLTRRRCGELRHLFP